MPNTHTALATVEHAIYSVFATFDTASHDDRLNTDYAVVILNHVRRRLEAEVDADGRYARMVRGVTVEPMPVHVGDDIPF